MLIRHSTTLFVLAALFATACDEPKSSGRDDLMRPGRPVTNTSAQLNLKQADPILAARNGSAIARLTDEVRVAPTTLKLVGTLATVRTAPYADAKVVELRNGAQVTGVARAHDYYLVAFTDPSEAKQTLAGWVYKDALEQHWVRPAAPESYLVCRNGLVRVQTDMEFCARPCNRDGDCAQAVCDGIGKLVDTGGALIEAGYCVPTSD